MDFFRNEPLSHHTTFKIGGPARLFLIPESEHDLTEAALFAYENKIALQIIGNGSNILVSDRGFDGLVIKTTSLKSMSVHGKIIEAQCGAMLPVLSSFGCEHSLSGLEFAQGIPGTVGGGLLMNCGAYGGEMSQIVRQTRYLNENFEVQTLPTYAHDFGYRESFFSKNPKNIILSSFFELAQGNNASISEKMRDFAAKRREKQPLEYPSAGSTFKRPDGHFAGKLIEQCDLKGTSIGGAEVSEKHAGFVINRRGATFKDVIALIKLIQKTVLEKTGVHLESEVKIIGEKH